MIILLNHPSPADVVDAWAVGDGEKIFRYRTEHPAESGNSIWDGKQIKLKGIRCLGNIQDIIPKAPDVTGQIRAQGGHCFTGDSVPLFGQFRQQAGHIGHIL